MDIDAAWDAVAGFLTSLALEKGLAANSREAYRRDLGDLILQYANDGDNFRGTDIETDQHILI